MKVYLVESAAKALGISTRQLLRMAKQFGLETVRMGTRQVYIFTEKDLKHFREARAK